MDYTEIVKIIANVLKQYDAERPIHKHFSPGIGPFGEPQIVSTLAERLTQIGIRAQTRRTPDLEIDNEWAIEFKIVRPYGDNGKEAENWSVNLLHPYEGNTSLLGDALKLRCLNNFYKKGLFLIGYEHNPAKRSLDPLILSFELIAEKVLGLNLGERIEERRTGLIHPEHQVVRCIGWELKFPSKKKDDENIKLKHTGRNLNEEWNVNAKHALYHREGNWYHYLKRFPGALFDNNGYVLFQTEEEYLRCEYLEFGDEVNVIGEISNIPGYVRIR